MDKDQAAKAAMDRLRATMVKHNLSQAEAADYLGVPTPTLVKWLNGTRTPGASTIRLIEVLGMLEVLAPAIHDHLIKR